MFSLYLFYQVLFSQVNATCGIAGTDDLNGKEVKLFLLFPRPGSANTMPVTASAGKNTVTPTNKPLKNAGISIAKYDRTPQ